MLVCRVSVCRVYKGAKTLHALHHFLTHKTKKSCNANITKCIDARRCRESGRMHSRTVSSRINFPNAFKASIQKRGVLKCPHTSTLLQQCIMIYRGVCIETNQMKGGLCLELDTSYSGKIASVENKLRYTLD